MHPKCEYNLPLPRTKTATTGVVLAHHEHSPPTFSSPPGQFVGLIAGGDRAIRNAVEGAEDSEAQGAADLAALSPPLCKLDVLIGIASSGRTPYVLGGLKHARSVGAATVGLACVKPSAFDGQCDVLIECVTGPEVVTGSTRLKAGTATKMVGFASLLLGCYAGMDAKRRLSCRY